jgi:hypothetical protein
MDVSNVSRPYALLNEPQNSSSDPVGPPPSEQLPRPPAPCTTLEAKPGVQHLKVDAFAIFDHADPDRAGPWIDRCEPDDPDAAYLIELYETLQEAIAAIRPRAERVAKVTFPNHAVLAASAADDIERELQVRHVRTRAVRGRDYRFCSCQMLPAALPQIRSGRREARAWLEILRQREVNEVNGALLPGPTSAGTLFIFITADALDIRPV